MKNPPHAEMVSESLNRLDIELELESDIFRDLLHEGYWSKEGLVGVFNKGIEMGKKIQLQELKDGERCV